MGGRHVRPVGFEKDIEKDVAGLLLGWRVLRVTPKMVTNGQALSWFQELCRVVEYSAIKGNQIIPPPHICWMGIPTVEGGKMEEIVTSLRPQGEKLQESLLQPPEKSKANNRESDRLLGQVQALNSLERQLQQSEEPSISQHSSITLKKPSS